MEYEVGKRLDLLDQKLDKIEQMVELILIKAYPEAEEEQTDVSKEHEKKVDSENGSKGSKEQRS